MFRVLGRGFDSRHLQKECGEGMLERENKFYKEHQAEFREKYLNKWLVIVGESLWGG